MTQLRTVDDVILQLDRVMERQGFRSAGVLVCAAMTGSQEAWPISARARFFESPQQARPRCEYESICLVEEWLPEKRIVSWIRNTLNGKLIVDERCASTSFQSASVEFVANTRWSSTGWSEWLMRCRIRSGPVEMGYKPVVHAGLPPYQDIATAANHWVFGTEPSTAVNTVVNEGQLVIVVPDMRGRILTGRWRSSDLILEFEAPSDAHLEVQIIFVGSRTERERRITLRSKTLNLEVPVDARSIRVFLVAESTLLSDLEFTRHNPDFGVDDDLHSVTAQAVRDLASGEGQSVEFKPFVRKADRKEGEFVETVVAFANSGGGRLYVGVTDRGELQSDADLRHASSCTTRDEGIKWVRARMRDLLTERLKSFPPLEIDSIEVHGVAIVVITVGVVSAIACSTHNNELFVRKGATNQRPDPAHELPALLRLRRFQSL